MDLEKLRDGAAYADQWLAHQRAQREIPGTVVAIQQADQMLLLSAHGLANLERATPMTPRHIFRIASHSKTFTATAIMQLVEGGRLRLDDAVSRHLPWLESTATVRQLMNHVGGIIRDGLDATFWHLERPFPDVRALREMVRATLPPNEQFKYSNVGYSLLGLVVETASGQPYNDYVREHIVDRLGLSDTGPETTAELAERLVTAYTPRRANAPRLPIDDVATSAMSAATGFYSTAADLCRYARAHYLGNEELLSDASKREMQQPYWEVAQAETSYGLGFSVQTIGKRKMIGHGGGFPGHSTTTLIDPADQLVVVVLNNTMGAGGLAAPLAVAIVRILDFALEASGPPLPSPRETFTGRFESLWSVTDIVAFGDALYGFSPDDDNPARHPTELEFLDADSLRIGSTNGYGSPGEVLRYERASDGSIEHVWIAGMRHTPQDASA